MWRKKLSGRKNIVILVSLVVASFALMTFDIRRSQNPTIIETALMWVVSPVQNLITLTLDSANDVVDHYLLAAAVSEENEKLKHELDKLIRQNNELREELRQRDRVGDLMVYQEERQLKSVVAQVIGRDATQWARVVFINKGTQDGITENLAVVTNGGIVGHVIQAGLNTSKVMLIVDGRSSVDTLFSDDRVAGIVVGTGMEFCEMKYVPHHRRDQCRRSNYFFRIGRRLPQGIGDGNRRQHNQSNSGPVSGNHHLSQCGFRAPGRSFSPFIVR